ncbi:unnamed protein product [Ectocarpus sp. 6 AP-2014]
MVMSMTPTLTSPFEAGLLPYCNTMVASPTLFWQHVPLTQTKTSRRPKLHPHDWRYQTPRCVMFTGKVFFVAGICMSHFVSEPLFGSKHVKRCTTNSEPRMILHDSILTVATFGPRNEHK